MLRHDLAVAATIGAGSRVLSLALLAMSYVMWPGSGNPIGGLGGRPFAVWDGAWYVSIAETGYHATPLSQGLNGPFYDVAFFPAWPVLMTIASGFGRLPTALISGVLANVLFVAACPLIYHATLRFLDRERALWTVVLVAFSPAAYVFSIGYAESLFVLLAAWAFARPSVGPAVLAQVTRLTGFAVGFGLATDAWIAGHRRQAGVLVVAPVAAFAAWATAIALITGRPDGYLLGSPSWYRSTGSSFGPGTLFGTPAGVAVGLYLSLLAVGCLTIFRRARGMAVYAALVLVAAFALGRWESMPRLALPAFPAVAGLVVMAWTKWRRLAVLATFIIGQALLVILVAAGLEAP